MSFPNFKKPSHILATWFGIGMLRPAPGTWGSLAALTSWYFLEILHPWTWIIIPGFILLAWCICEIANKESESNDHSSIVIDEVAGMLVALAFVERNLLIYVFVFFLFRLFDIWKPWPISWVDKNIKGGWGILFDDLIAGLFSGAIILALVSLI